ncbi:MAG: ATP-binding cassette domain-containing protein [Magnetococcus sp. DMHC-1]
MPGNGKVIVESLSKSFRVARAPTSLKESISGLVAHFFTTAAEKSDDLFWVFRNLSFDAVPGDVVAIRGKNGAGKSTLLKVLSRVIPPTSGRAMVKGKLAPMLEVGAGFHPELTGRENVFLSAAILGMSKAEIRSKFDAIVQFSGIERFLDTPVKHFSSGMYIRLGFSVAVHCQPDVIVADEVFGVGDAEFKEKNLQRMLELKNEGTIIFFVTHDEELSKKIANKEVFIS